MQCRDNEYTEKDKKMPIFVSVYYLQVYNIYYNITIFFVMFIISIVRLRPAILMF